VIAASTAASRTLSVTAWAPPSALLRGQRFEQREFEGIERRLDELLRR
jgi:hypothetical protein